MITEHWFCPTTDHLQRSEMQAKAVAARVRSGIAQMIHDHPESVPCPGKCQLISPRADRADLPANRDAAT